MILVDGQPVMGDLAKYQGAGDELQRLGTENVERIESFKVQPVPSMALMLLVVLLMLSPINLRRMHPFNLMRKVVEKKGMAMLCHILTSLCAQTQVL